MIRHFLPPSRQLLYFPWLSPLQDRFPGISRATEDQPADRLRILTIGTADSGGTMYPVGKAIAQAISQADASITVNLSASEGSVSNALALQNGEIDLGLVSGDVAYAALNGQQEFEGAPCRDLRVIAAVYPSLSNWIAPSSLGISYIHELKGRRIAIGPRIPPRRFPPGSSWTQPASQKPTRS